MQTTRNYFIKSLIILCLIVWIFIVAPILLRNENPQYQTVFWTGSGFLLIPIVLFALRRQIKRWINRQGK